MISEQIKKECDGGNKSHAQMSSWNHCFCEVKSTIVRKKKKKEEIEADK